MRTQLHMWDERVSRLTQRSKQLREEYYAAKTLSDNSPEDVSLIARVSELEHALVVQEESESVARDAYKDLSNAFLDLSQEMRNSSSPNVPRNTGSSIRLSAPKPFCIGDDFDVFAELFGSYVANESFDTQLQVLKSTLSAESYRAGRSAIVGTHRQYSSCFR